jgi:glycosyltransferase involved in cell wall biosynthesis
LNGLVPQIHLRMRGVWDLWARTAIRRVIDRLSPAIVQTYLGRATRLTHLPRRSSVIHIARLGGYYDVAGYRHADAWVANTRALCDYLVRGGLPADRIYYIGNFVELPGPLDRAPACALRERLALAEDAYVLLAVGRLHAAKGLEVSLQALALLPERICGRTVYLVLVGAGPKGPTLQALASKLGVQERVRFAGWQHALTPYYFMSNVLLSSAHHETLGNTLLEAWAHRIAVVATATIGARELLRHGENGWLVPIGDPQGLADALSLVLRDEPLRAALAQAGFEELCRRFSRDAIVGAYRTLYTDLVAAGA